MNEYAQLRRYAREAFGPEASIRVQGCTQLAHSTLDRPVFDLELEGVPEDWQGVRLGAPGTRLPDRTWERTTRASCQGRYQPAGPRARMTRPKSRDVLQQQPAEAQDAADHTRDLAMANAEPAVVDVPVPLYIDQWMLIDECPVYVFFTLFGCWREGGGGSQGGRGTTFLCSFPVSTAQK